MDITVLDKTMRGVNNGWDYREYTYPQTIVIHTTNGRYNSSYASEAGFLYASYNVSAHYLVGKKGQITRFLDPRIHRAWHAGVVVSQRWNNNNSIGIECHYTPGEGAWPVVMKQALTDLVRQLMIAYNIKVITNIDTHRKIAIPIGRKIDPSGFNDTEFYAWRNTLGMRKYRVMNPQVNVRQSPCILPDNIAGTLYQGDEFYSAAVKQDECNGNVRGITTYAHITHGFSRGKPIDGLGFVHTSVLTQIA